MNTAPDYYAVLDLPRDADERAIKRAWREQVRLHHPDRPENAGSSAAKDRMRLLRQAYDVLSDVDRREDYDRMLAGGVAAAGLDWHHSWDEGQTYRRAADREAFDLKSEAGSDLDGVFADLFGMPTAGAAEAEAAGAELPPDEPPPRQQPGGPDLWDPSRLGAELPPEADPGPAPGGADAPPGFADPGGGFAARWGFRAADMVGAAFGGGDGGAGDDHPGGGWDPPEGRDVVGREPAASPFRLGGLDRLLDVPLTPFEAASGLVLTVPTEGGSKRVRVPPGARSGQQIRLVGLGVAGPAGRVGDQVLVLLIQLPPELNEQQLQLLWELDDSTGFDPRSGAW